MARPDVTQMTNEDLLDELNRLQAISTPAPRVPGQPRRRPKDVAKPAAKRTGWKSALGLGDDD